MPNQQTQTNTGRPKRRKSSASRPKNAKKTSEKKAAKSEGLAGFALLADPVAIAGGVVPEMPPLPPEPSARFAPLPASPDGPTAEAPAPPARPSTDPDAAIVEAPPAPAPTNMPAPERAPEPNARRIDAATARQLAAEARERERASREALEATRQALAQRPARASDPASRSPEPPAPNETTSEPSDRAPESERRAKERQEDDGGGERTRAESPRESTARAEEDGVGWTRRALVGRAAEPTPGAAATARSAERDAARPDPGADDHEVEATLAIARETTLGQKREIAALREKLAARDARIAELEAATHEREALEALRRESEQAIGALRERLERSEREREQAASAREQLERALEERQAMIDARGAQLDAFHDRLAAQDRALEAARREFALERERHTRTRALLGRLRETLLQAVPDEAVASLDGATDADPSAAAMLDPSGGEANAALASPDADADEAPATSDPARPEPTRDVPTARIGRGPAPAPGRRPAVFAAWLDDQIRRRFGPMGIDRLADLLETPLARRARSDQAQSIVLIGHGAWHRAAALAEHLVETTPGGFTLHVVDPDGEPRTPTLAFDSPLRDFVEGAEAPATPEALATLLDRLAPAAIVSHDFLTRLASPDPWIDALEAECHRACLLFVEGTGLGAIEAPETLRAIGDRIWDLMPERYTRVPGTDRRLDSWLEAFGARDVTPANALGERLRERFRFELSGQFGFLATPFLSSPIAANFDPDATRDRRFLAQVADLDDRKIEAGLAPPLHLLALVDPLAETD